MVEDRKRDIVSEADRKCRAGRDCNDFVIDQIRYDDMLCEQHYRDAILWDEADNMNQSGWED